jgi:RNA polymerase sigma factor (sigma-70 family)
MIEFNILDIDGRNKYTNYDEVAVLKLVEAYRNGDKDLYEEIAQLMTPVIKSKVYSIKWSAVHHILPLDDMVQLAHLALMQCLDVFDINRGPNFASLFIFMSDFKFFNALRDHYFQGARIPGHLSTLKYKYRTVMAEFDKLGETPTDDEIIDKINTSWQNKKMMMNPTRLANVRKIEIVERTVSLYEPDGHDINRLASHTDKDLDANAVLIAKDKSDQLERLFENLDERESYILKRYYGIIQPRLILREIGAEFNLSAQSILNIKNNAIKKLQHIIRKQELQRKFNL